MRRQPGESMRKWTSRFEAFIKKTGKALHQADAEIDESNFLHPLIQGILLLECSNLSPAENAAVLATSGATTKEGGSIGNSYLYVDLAASFIAQWDVEALIRRDKAPQKRSHHTVAAATTTWDLSSPSNSFLEPDTVDGGELEMAGPEVEEPEEIEYPDDGWTDEFPSERPGAGRSIWLSGSSRGLCCDGVQECFIRHEKCNENIYGGQGSGFSSKTRKRLLLCGWSGRFRWFSNNDTERITSDWFWERCEHWNE